MGLDSLAGLIVFEPVCFPSSWFAADEIVRFRDLALESG
jgi:hypothetical protein